MSRVIMIVTAVILGLLVITSGCAGEAPGEKAADFYKGKTIDFATSGRPGAVTDITTRVFQPYIEQYTGSTTVIKDMSGAGGMEGQNYTWQASPDGLTVGSSTLLSLTMADLLDDPSCLYEVDQFGFLGCVGSESDIFWVKDDGPIKSIADLQAMESVQFIAPAPGDGRTVCLMMTSYFLDLNAKIACGFNTDECKLAVMRGDSAGFVTTPGSFLRGVDQGWRALFMVDNKRCQALPDVPALTEIFDLPQDRKELLELKGMLHAGTVLYTSPGVPENRLSFLQGVVQQIVEQEAEFRSEVDKTWGYSDVPYPSAEETTQVVREAKAKEQLIQEKMGFLIETYLE